MNPEASTEENKLLSKIPDFLDWKAAKQWINKGKKLVQQCTEKEILEGEVFSLEWMQIAEKDESPFGLYPSKQWRKFVLSAFFADMVSYAQPVAQVCFKRLLFVMHAFPQGFRTWWIRLANGTTLPVGYTGFYPMLETTFELFKKNPGKLKDRMVVPHMHLNEERPYLYLFNFSVAPAFKVEYLTRTLMKSLVEDIQRHNPKGLACITVSEDGIRIAKRFEMSYKGDLTIDGCSEGVYVKLFNR
jgi:hypothetical protein